MGNFISCDVIIEDGVFISENSSIGHDSKLYKGVIILPMCAVSGCVVLGEYSFIGMNACIKQGIEIGKFSMVSMGGVVAYDVKDFEFVVGNPARVSCKNSKQRIF